MRSVRFVHAADLHLGAPFQGVDASDARVRAALLASTYEALDRIVELCFEEKVDFLLIAGDVHNSREKSRPAQFRFQAALERLAQAGIPVYISRGNHDPADGWSAGLRLPETVHYFSTAAVEAFVVERDGEAICTLYGRGYERAAEKRDFASGYRRSPGDRIAIGVLHTNVGSRADFEDYAPASMETLRGAGMDYWALGHIHKPEVLCATPAIVYAGSPQGLNPKEDGIHGCYLVEVDASGATPEFKAACSLVWARRSADATACADIEDVRGVLRRACDEARADADGRPAIARIELTGRCAAHEALVRGTAMADVLCDLREEQLSAYPWVWIDRITDRTAASLDVDALRAQQDFTGDLVRLVDELVADPDAVAALLAEVLEPIEGSVGVIESDLGPEELVLRARDVCLDRLEGEAR
jgi:DNA repair exonuclease SbcCD nuclease subunit